MTQHEGLVIHYFFKKKISVQHKTNEDMIELLRPLEEFNKILKDVATPTASLILSVAKKLRTITKDTEHNDTLILEIKKQLKKFAEQISSTYCEIHHLDMAQYFDPRVAINNEKLDIILAALKVDYQALNRSKSGLGMLFEDDQEGIRVTNNYFSID